VSSAGVHSRLVVLTPIVHVPSVPSALVRTPRKVLAVGLTVLALLAPTVVTTGPRAGATPDTSRRVAGPGVDLITNGGAEAGAASASGYDAVTIPGWRIAGGLPSVIAYGTAGFVPKTVPRPPSSGRRLFVGGAGGPATLSQRIALTTPNGAPVRRATFRVSAALGAKAAHNDAAWLRLTFLTARGQVLGVKTVGPVTARQRRDRTRLLDRSATGAVPPGTASAVVAIDLHGTATDYNGPDGSTVGFNYAYADDIDLTVSKRVVAPRAVRIPPVHVPRFAHVVLVYLENQDYHDIVGNTKQAPFINSLIPKGSLFAEMYAEEHPSDGNYLAFAGGSTFGIPLDDPPEEGSQYTINAPNIGDSLDAAHETWKAYLQGAAGPCDDTVHNQYWDDDLPFLFFRDIRERPAYCDAHVVPMGQYRQDLRRARTTPSFSWLGANDCDDMEGCGIRAGDRWLQSLTGALFHSPAWTTQRTLLVITWDEDAEDGQHPAQRIPTIVVGSRMVKQGFVSTVRYSQYSLLRTVEAALGLATMTKNDLYAKPTNDIFK
jgi:hypothetical protein